jgi:RimJ/RimL family protein N-acetyltransferase
MEHILETDRLIISELKLTDFQFILFLLNSPGWLEYIGDRGVNNKEQAMLYLQNGPLKSYMENGFGLYKVEEKTSGLPMGLCGLLKRETLDHPDLGFAFLPEFMGKGYAFESVEAILGFAKSKLGIQILQAIVLPVNIPSIKLLKKSGFQFLKTIQFQKGEELNLFQVNL